MVFKKKEETTGEVDRNINRAGRPKKDPNASRRKLKDTALLNLARKLNPHLAAAIRVHADVINDEEANIANRMKASVFFIKTYQDLIEEIYSDEPEKADDKEKQEIKDEDLPEEVQPKGTRPVLSLRVISTPDELKEDE